MVVAAVWLPPVGMAGMPAPSVGMDPAGAGDDESVAVPEMPLISS